MLTRSLDRFACAMILAIALGFVVHRGLRASHRAATESLRHGPPADEAAAKDETNDVDDAGSTLFSLAHWLARAEADPMLAAQDLTAAFAELDPATLDRLAKEWIDLKSDRPRTLAERIVHDALFFRWAAADPAGLLAFISQGPRHRYGHSNAVAAAIVHWASRNPSQAFEAARLSHDQMGSTDGVLQAVELLGRRCATALADHLARAPDIDEYRNTRTIIDMLGDWADESPVAARAWLRNLRRIELRTKWERDLFLRWAEKNPEEAAAALEKERPGRNRTLQMKGVVSAWAKQDPEAAMAWAERMGDRAVLENSRFEKVYERAFEDPFSVDAETIASLPRGDRRMELLRYVLAEGGKRDFKRTLAFIDSLPEEDRTVLRLKLARNLFDDGATSYSPQEALDFLAQLPPSFERARSTEKLAKNLAERDPEALFSWMTENPESLDSERMIEAAAAPWVESDLAGAQAVLMELPDSLASRKLASELARKLLETDPEAVLDLAETLSDATLARNVRETYEVHQAEQDPHAFLRSAAEGEVSPSAEAVTIALGKLAEENVHAALEWARTRADRLPPEALAKLVRKLAYSDLDAAKTVANAVVKDPSLTSDVRSVVTSVTNAWTMRDADAASAWAMSLPDSDLRDDAVSVLVREWSRFDWPAARQWIEALPQGPFRDEALEAARWPLISSNPRLLLEALPLLSSDETRQALRTQLFSQWRTQDAAAARAAALEVGLPSEEMETLFGEE